MTVQEYPIKYREIEGDLITLAKQGKFDVIVHGCNCFCIMGAGIAPQMAKTFGADRFSEERESQKGNINKLGSIDYAHTYLKGENSLVNYKSPYVYLVPKVNDKLEDDGWFRLTVINAYTQFDITGRRVGKIDLDYEALTLCMRKINHIFKGKHIGLPKIGAGLAGGNWDVIKAIIKKELVDCNITIVNYVPNINRIKRNT